MIDFKNYHLSKMTKEVIEDYINKKRQKTPRLAKDLFLLIRSVLNYAKDVRHLLNEVPKFDLKFSKKKRAKANPGNITMFPSNILQFFFAVI